MQFDIGPHIDDDVLEKFLMQRLNEVDAVSVEEHLLACSACQSQAEEAGEFVRVVKAALPEVPRLAPAKPRFAWPIPRFGRSWLSAAACASAVATIALGLFVARDYYTTAASHPSELRLYSMRGPEAAVIHTRPTELILHLDSAGLSGGTRWVVRIVDASGDLIWMGRPGPLHDPVNVVLGRPLAAGRYWVRLMDGDELVREYGLQVD